MEHDDEKKNKRTGLIISAAVHVLLLILFVFILAWREPDPPLPEYGIEINFGLAEQGSGDIQPQTPVTTQDEAEDPAPEEPAETKEEVADVVEPALEEVVEDIPEEAVEQPPVVENTQDSPEVIEPQPEVTKEVKKEPKKKSEEVRKPEPKPESPTPTPARDKTSGNKGEGKESSAESSQGDDKDMEGDKGSEQGTLNADALYGKPGGGQGGPALSIVGWVWDAVPKEKDTSNENGTITFEFLIDEDGYVIRVVTLQRSVTPSVAKFYEDQLKNTTFSRTGSGAGTAGNTKGTVTFTIVSK